MNSFVRNVLQRVYDATIRESLPRKWCVYGTIPARDARLLDTTDYVPDYKQGLEEAIHASVDAGDTITLIGGGRGISSVWLARQGATVVAYEAAAEMLPIARQTVQMQDVAGDVEFRHALVGEDVDVFGSARNATRVPPDKLTTHDVLVMDCEGAELSILESLRDWPPAVIVETHPGAGASTDAVQAVLSDAGYAVKRRQYQPGEHNKHVLSATAE